MSAVSVLFAVVVQSAAPQTAAAQTAAAQTAAPQTAAADSRPALVVVITLDQFQVPYIDRYSAEFTGGLKRLLRGGAYFPNTFQDHAITETAPAHATLLSGRFPRSHGILSNAADVADNTSPLVGANGTGASPYRFRGGTLVDWLRVQDPLSRGLSVSRKPRSAILPFGKSRQPTFWFTRGRFVTSTWFADTLPAWVRAFNARGIPASMAGSRWDLLMPAAAYTERDSVPLENAGKDFTFPHIMPADTTILDRIIEYPVMDSILLSFALEGVRTMALGGSRHMDILSVSLSTTDAVGHRYGPDSREIHDQVLRVDRALGVFMDSIYASIDSSRVIFAVTADHGITPFPELGRTDPGLAPDGHGNVRAAVSAARAVLRAAGADTSAASFASGIFTVNRTRVAEGFDTRPAIDAFIKAARSVPAVATITRRSDLARYDTVRNSDIRRWIHTLPPDNKADVLVTVRPGAVWGSGTDAEHGTANDMDARVPLILYGAPFQPGVYPQFARSVDIAPTLAYVMGVTPYEPLDGKLLLRALKKRPH